MPNLREALNETLPEQPGERRISVHWFFPAVALFCIGAGIACLRGSRDLLVPGWFCIILGLFVLLGFVLCVWEIGRGGKVEALFSIRVRLLVLLGSMAGFNVLCFIIATSFGGKLAWPVSVIWVCGGIFMWRRIVRYFRDHPPKH
jgi:hypothetical protein